LCPLYSNTNILICAQIMGSFSSFFRTLLCSYHNILFMWLVGALVLLVQLVSFDCLLQLVSFDCLIAGVSLCYAFVAYHSLAIFVPQYSLSSSKYLPLDMCIAFHSLVEKYTIYGGTQFILAFFTFCPFWQSMPMGEKFQRVLWGDV
jgi:hypothetical protein